MLWPSRKLMHAVEAVVDIAYNAGPQPVQSQEITSRQGIPRRYLEPVLQQLVRAGILAGVRGPRGGYRLARERRRITLGEIVRVVRDVDAGLGGREAPSQSAVGEKVLRPLWLELEEEFMARLEGITVEDLCLKARDAGVDSALFRRLDYTI